MPVTAIQIRHRYPVDYGVTPGSSTLNRSNGELIKRVINTLRAAVSDAQPDSEYVFQYDSADICVANAGLALGASSGTLTATLNGVAVAVTYATSTTNSCGLLAAAINASTDALVKGLFAANNLTATITCASVAVGDYVDVCGTRFTAVAATPVEIYRGASKNTFVQAGTDAQTGAALAAAINASPGVSRYVFAIDVSNVVRLFARQFVFSGTVTFAWPTKPGTPGNSLTTSNTTRLAVSAAALAAGAFVGICATTEGVQGNQATIAVSGTNLAVLNTETRLKRGLGLTTGSITDDA
jgi:hypothetical protein